MSSPREKFHFKIILYLREVIFTRPLKNAILGETMKGWLILKKWNFFFHLFYDADTCKNVKKWRSCHFCFCDIVVYSIAHNNFLFLWTVSLIYLDTNQGTWWIHVGICIHICVTLKLSENVTKLVCCFLVFHIYNWLVLRKGFYDTFTFFH